MGAFGRIGGDGPGLGGIGGGGGGSPGWGGLFALRARSCAAASGVIAIVEPPDSSSEAANAFVARTTTLGGLGDWAAPGITIAGGGGGGAGIGGLGAPRG